MNQVLRRVLLIPVLLTVLLSGYSAASVPRGGNEYDAVCDHLEEKYGGEKVKIPFMWLARMAVGIVRPAGVKAFKVTIYRNLKFSPGSLDTEMRTVMSEAFGEDWSPILRVISRDGQQVYMNMREYKNSVKVLLVSIDRDEAVVVRARFNPEKLAEFIGNPKIFGISLDGKSDEPEFEKPAVAPDVSAEPASVHR